LHPVLTTLIEELQLLSGLLDKADMTIEELQQAGYNVDPLITGCCGEEVGIRISIEDAAKTKADSIIGVRSALAKSGWFNGLIYFHGKQPEQITVSPAVQVMCSLLARCAHAIATAFNARVVHTAAVAPKVSRHGTAAWTSSSTSSQGSCHAHRCGCGGRSTWSWLS
jgi:hypothetical protein